MTSVNSAKESLIEAANIIGNRGMDHGHFAIGFVHVAAMWSAYLGHEIKPRDVPFMMALLKISRAVVGNPNEMDHIRDALGYIALAGEINVDN